MAKKDYYDVLGISKGSTKKEIKSAYRKLAKEFHPDRNKEEDAEAKFKEVQEAYEVLYDDQKRSAYDKFGHAGTQGFGGGGAGFGGFDGGFDFDMGNIGDIFEQMFGGGFGGFSRGSQNGPSKGQDIAVSLKLEFNEAVFGEEKVLKYKRRTTCDKCDGTGADNPKDVETCSTCQGQGRVARVQQTFIGNVQTVVACPDCRGEGKIIEKKCEKCNGNTFNDEQHDFTIKIPSGIPDGVTLRFQGQGHAGKKGGGYGDLYVEVEVTSDEILERRGNDIYMDVIISAEDAVLGANVPVKTVHGNETMKVPSGTQPETILKLSGKGGPKFRGKGNGDQYVRILVKIPKKLSNAEKKIWEELRSLNN